ncbi:MAG: hypothetical protein M1820_009053 [Bogoriella megaspora]|nr:MAG: hypothetical protein M1820_009053 [Bogoriella megaspora]
MAILRVLARSLPRAAPRLSNRTNIATLGSLRRISPVQSSWTSSAIPRLSAAFSTSRRRMEQDDITQELAAKLENEYIVETKGKNPDSVSTAIKDYIDNSAFTLEDTAGHEEVVLSRKYGDENIKVTFSIADLHNIDQDQEDLDQDRAFYDEGVDMDSAPTDTQSGGANTKGAVNQGRTSGGNIKVAPEDDIAPADRPELRDDEAAMDEDAEGSGDYPARLIITISRDGRQGALSIEAIAQHGGITIDNVYYFQNSDMADAKTADVEWNRRGVYAGPPFGNLDEELQVLMEKYLEERGVNAAMAVFVPEYIDYKEQREYLSWLDNIKKFVE